MQGAIKVAEWWKILQILAYNIVITELLENNWCLKRDSNPRPCPYEGPALPAELLRPMAAENGRHRFGAGAIALPEMRGKIV